MKKVFILLVFIGSHLLVAGQTEKEQIDSAEQQGIIIVEQMPIFPGGKDKMKAYIEKKMNYPVKAKLEGRGGVTYVTFFVEPNGKLTDIHVLKPASGGTDLDEEALRIVRSMPKWKPGKRNGEKVRVAYTLPVRFIGV